MINLLSVLAPVVFFYQSTYTYFAVILEQTYSMGTVAFESPYSTPLC